MEELSSKVIQAVQALQEELRADGSSVELVSIEGDEVTVKLSGALCHCPSSTLSFYQEVSGFLRERIPEIRRVRAL